MSKPLVSVVIPSFNEGDWLTRTVRGVLEKTDYPHFEIVVVADGCTDKSVAQLQACRFPNLKIIELAASQGAIVARNQGATVAQGEVLVFIDSHQEPLTHNWLQVLVDLLERPNAGAATVNIAALGQKDRLGYLYTLKDWSLEPTWRRPENFAGGDCLTGAIPGGCFAIKKILFEKTGGFNPCLKKWGREDFEYSLRLWRLGYDLWFSDQAVMGHAFDHQRQFEISWDQVDFNTLWIAQTLFDEAGQSLAKNQLESQRVKTFKKLEPLVGKALIGFDDSVFKRKFEDYRSLFLRHLEF